MRPLREVLAALLFLAVTAQLVRRYRRATRLMQRTLEPVLTIAAARCCLPRSRSRSGACTRTRVC